MKIRHFEEFIENTDIQVFTDLLANGQPLYRYMDNGQ